MRNRLCLSVVALLASVSALAAPPRTPPGLERVCDRYETAPTPAQTIAEGVSTALRTVPCDLTAERGICLFGGASMAATPGAAAAVVPVVSAWEPGVDTGLTTFVGSVVDLSGLLGHPTHPVTVYVDDQLVLDRAVLDGPLLLQGQLSQSNDRLHRWTHVAVVHTERGLATFSGAPDATLGDMATTVTAAREVLDDGAWNTFTIAGRTRVDGGWVNWKTKVSVNDVMDASEI